MCCIGCAWANYIGHRILNDIWYDAFESTISMTSSKYIFCLNALAHVVKSRDIILIPPTTTGQIYYLFGPWQRFVARVCVRVLVSRNRLLSLPQTIFKYGISHSHVYQRSLINNKVARWSRNILLKSNQFKEPLHFFDFTLIFFSNLLASIRLHLMNFDLRYLYKWGSV